MKGLLRPIALDYFKFGMTAFFRGLLSYKYLFFFFIFFCSYSSQAQTPKTDSLQTALKSVVEDTNKVKILKQLCWELRFAKPEKALEYCKQSLKIAEKISYKKYIADAHFTMGIIYDYKLGSYKVAKSHLEKAIEIYKKTGDKNGMAQAFNSLGIVYKNLGQFDKSVKCYMETLKILEENYEDSSKIASSYINLGNIYYYSGNLDKALEYYQKANDMYQILGEKERIALSIGNIGFIYAETKEYKKSIEHFLTSLKIYQETSNKKEIARTLNNIGELYASIKNYDKAKENIKQAIAAYSELNDKEGLAMSLGALGEIYNETGDYNTGLDYFKKALKTARNIGAIIRIKDCYKGLANSYVFMEDYKSAYEYHLLYSQLKDSLFNEKSTKIIAEMQTKYETVKKEKEIELLSKDNKMKSLQLAKKEEVAKKQKIIIWSVVSGLLLVLSLAIIIFRSYKQKQKANQLLAAQNEEINVQKEEISAQRDMLEEKNKGITDSIHYAVRIQNAILPKEELINEYLPESFVLYKPKDIISGDFYFLARVNQYTIIAAVDCTGHGVPGAFMSLIGNDFLNQIVLDKHITNSAKALIKLDEKILHSLNPEGTEVQDGMDIAFCAIDNNKNILLYAGANRPLLLFRKGELIEYKPNKLAIGGYHEGEKCFTNHKIELQKGDTFYIFSDGYADQFGGESTMENGKEQSHPPAKKISSGSDEVIYRGRKFMRGKFKKLLLSIQNKSMQQQKEILDKTIEEWMGDIEQGDDICVIGVRF